MYCRGSWSKKTIVYSSDCRCLVFGSFCLRFGLQFDFNYLRIGTNQLPFGQFFAGSSRSFGCYPLDKEFGNIGQLDAHGELRSSMSDKEMLSIYFKTWRQSQHLVDPLLMEIKSKVNSSPKSRCSLVSDCVNQVKPGTKNVFGDVTFNLFQYILNTKWFNLDIW